MMSSISSKPVEDFLCIGPFSWGRSDDLDTAIKNCVMNINVTIKGDKSEHCVVYEVFSDDLGINESGSVSWPIEDRSPEIVWMGSEYCKRNPDRFVGEVIG